MTVYELNMDGLVGPTHHYAGLATGNVASMNNAQSTSNPQAAALQGLKKMRLLHDMGIKQAILPPHQRPNLKLLHQLGFHGTPEQQVKQAFKQTPELLSACYSASSMWTANAATVTASTDSTDHKVHMTAANLISNLHRQQEAEFSKKLLSFIFSNPQYFTHHDVLPSAHGMGDEGAANHNRLCSSHAHDGINLFVYGQDLLDKSKPGPKRYPARQTKEASAAIIRNHQLKTEHVVLAQQNPNAIDNGVFHNDVIAVANESVLLIHQDAFYQQQQILDELKVKAFFPLTIIELSQEQLSLEDAVQSYLFNSQLLTIPDQKHMMLLAPIECQAHVRVRQCIETLIADNNNPIQKVLYLDLKQSMRNGGGPACLRLRIPLSQTELMAMHQGVLMNSNRFDLLEQWVFAHYRTQLHIKDLVDPQLIDESFRALDELTQILQLGSIYPFQN